MRYKTPAVITPTAPACPIESAANPMARGNTVPPKRPIIMSPDTSSFSLGEEFKAWANTTENTFELPNPINPIPMYREVRVSQTNNIPMARSIIPTLIPRNIFGDIDLRIKAPRKHPAVRKIK